MRDGERPYSSDGEPSARVRRSLSGTTFLSKTSGGKKQSIIIELLGSTKDEIGLLSLAVLLILRVNLRLGHRK